MIKLSIIFKKISAHCFLFLIHVRCRQNAITLSNLRVKSAIIKIIEIKMEGIRYIVFVYIVFQNNLYIYINIKPSKILFIINFVIGDFTQY